jgi:hypothetical protein
MFVDFTKGHWLTVYRDRIGGEAAAPTMRIMAKDAPAGVDLADGLRTYSSFPPAFMFRLMTAWAAMGFWRPKFAWQS